MTTDKENKKEIKETYNFKSREVWMEALNAAPAPAWIEKRSVGNKDLPYISIAVQQALADMFFNEFRCKLFLSSADFTNKYDKFCLFINFE